MIERDFDKLKYDKILIENNNMAKILLGDYLMIVHDVKDESDVIYSLFKNREYILTDHKPLDNLINNMNSFINNCND